MNILEKTCSFMHAQLQVILALLEWILINRLAAIITPISIVRPIIGALLIIFIGVLGTKLHKSLLQKSSMLLKQYLEGI